MNKDKVEKELLKTTKAINKRKIKKEESFTALKKWANKYFPPQNEKIDNTPVPMILAELLELYRFDDGSDFMYTLYLQWLVEHFITNKIVKEIDNIVKLYNYLVKGNHTLDNRGGHGYGDTYAFYIPHKEKKLFCITGQSWQVLFIVKQTKLTLQLHIRQYWDTYTKEDWRAEDWQKTIDIEQVLIKASWLLEEFSDNFPQNKYIKRPDLKYYSDRDYDLKYCDGRDDGFVLSFKLFVGGSEEIREGTDLPDFRLLNTAMFSVKSLNDWFLETNN